ncbi:hypothetical protein SAMN04489860_0037 [Paraoerskovia marina]|uniref:Uncharacterized protein n=1 Tax=Paraoerskovia marina TaxID=545619 RepID=A0A1H1LV44_9CELL|nr:hypothetical protein [Paraoerskovia marina]SDR78287.1 hypothetical protein SAMN04489860_0037 [Paraoerskovia marina]
MAGTSIDDAFIDEVKVDLGTVLADPLDGPGVRPGTFAEAVDQHVAAMNVLARRDEGLLRLLVSGLFVGAGMLFLALLGREAQEVSDGRGSVAGLVPFVVLLVLLAGGWLAYRRRWTAVRRARGRWARSLHLPGVQDLPAGDPAADASSPFRTRRWPDAEVVSSTSRDGWKIDPMSPGQLARLVVYPFAAIFGAVLLAAAAEGGLTDWRGALAPGLLLLATASGSVRYWRRFVDAQRVRELIADDVVRWRAWRSVHGIGALPVVRPGSVCWPLATLPLVLVAVPGIVTSSVLVLVISAPVVLVPWVVLVVTHRRRAASRASRRAADLAATGAAELVDLVPDDVAPLGPTTAPPGEVTVAAVGDCLVLRPAGASADLTVPGAEVAAVVLGVPRLMRPRQVWLMLADGSQICGTTYRPAGLRQVARALAVPTL